MAARLAVPALLLLLLLAASSLAAAGGEEGPEKVAVALYYESLCPYSARFVVDHLAKVFEDGLRDAVDLTLVPYGNARVRAGGEISCQHGPYECLLNTVEACAIDAWPDLDVHFRFIYCVEDLVVKRQYKEWESCFEKLELDPKPVTECYKSEQGHKLDLKYANQTDALVPPHRYVPWVVVDGQPLLEDYENFEAYICKAYKGSPPKVCDLPMALETAVARNGVTSNSGSIKLESDEEEGRESKIKMRLPDDDN
ncbi:Gamma-interferon-inducible lysosomal thiol reductase [Dichanthelium oligosanthes]|uniref:Gamma-interferon-inducible lysosomal thiol reductase n=1 Tax=Dichanthelium oligosanthes TaxID=888268 RepID=A0A1E5VWR7_9POAL|nr:Gamma-interferon-inducible lysosomal thiol reductase [Dichanthelium oligosanthes]